MGFNLAFNGLKLCSLCDNVKKYSGEGQDPDDNMVREHYILDT